eukprot:scaffold88752_cov60-Phaeocystis_antarctica.AAC.1
MPQSRCVVHHKLVRLEPLRLTQPSHLEHLHRSELQLGGIELQFRSHHSSVVAPLPTHGRNFSPAKTAACQDGNLSSAAATAASHAAWEAAVILTLGAAPSTADNTHSPIAMLQAAFYGRSRIRGIKKDMDCL